MVLKPNLKVEALLPHISYHENFEEESLKQKLNYQIEKYVKIVFFFKLAVNLRPRFWNGSLNWEAANCNRTE